MEEFNWTSTIRVNLFLLRCVGLWPEKDTLRTLNMYTIYASLAATVIVGGQNLTQFINIFFVYDDLEALIATLFILTTNILVIIKMSFFVRNIRVIKQLLETLKRPQFMPKSFDQVQLIRPSLRRWKVSYIVFSSIVATNLFLWTITPLVNQDRKLPFLAWYPFNTQESPNYQIVYLYQAVCIWYITGANLNMDCLTYALLMYIWSQCDILCDDLRQLRGDHVEFNQKLIGCIKHHKNILSFAEGSNRIFDMIILGQFTTSTLALAASMFRLSLTDSLDITAVTNFNYLIGMTAQLFLYCWFGNEVEIKSNEIPYAIYQSDWITQPLQTQTNMIIFTERCQKPVKVTALNLFVLSLHTFINIFRTAWSYFAVLNSVNE